MKVNRRFFYASVLSLVLVLNLCAFTYPTDTQSVLVTTQQLVKSNNSAKINKTSATLVKGQTLSLKLSNVSVTVKWSSSNTRVATVSSKGKVTAKAKGTATITAKAGSKKYNCKVKVETPKISASKVTLAKGKTKKLSISGTSQKVTWSSSKKSVAVVSSSGKVTAKGSGSATITAKLASGKSYICKVTVKVTTDTVYITRTGNKYHRAGCRYLRQSKIAISLKEAKKEGYTACSVCF